MSRTTSATPSGRDLATALRPHGHRITRQRRAVWDVLQRASGHLTAEQIADRAAHHDRRLNVASVYRTLAVLAALGLARESRLGDGDASRWELAHPDEHFHVVCERCGDVDHHVGSLVDEIRTHLADGHGFEADTVELVVTGQCATCRTPGTSTDG